MKFSHAHKVLWNFKHGSTCEPAARYVCDRLHGAIRVHIDFISGAGMLSGDPLRPQWPGRVLWMKARPMYQAIRHKAEVNGISRLYPLIACRAVRLKFRNLTLLGSSNVFLWL